MAIDDPANKLADSPTKRILIAELTWAKLYTKTMNKALNAITTAVRRKTISKGTEMRESVQELHDRLRSANENVDELRDHAGLTATPVENRDETGSHKCKGTGNDPKAGGK